MVSSGKARRRTKMQDKQPGWRPAQGHLLIQSPVLEALKPPDSIQTSINPQELNLSLCFPVCSLTLRSPGHRRLEVAHVPGMRGTC